MTHADVRATVARYVPELFPVIAVEFAQAVPNQKELERVAVALCAVAERNDSKRESKEIHACAAQLRQWAAELRLSADIG